jgi:hypothetical protein
VWVIQEAARARTAYISCGPHRTKWADAMLVVFFSYFMGARHKTIRERNLILWSDLD